MPNWCNNSITIEGPVDKIRALWEAAQAREGLLEAMVPIGEWKYDTAVESWGTKWDISLEGLEFTDLGDGTATISGWFDSAWAPPIGAYETFFEDNDDVSISASYFEPGMDFAGFWSSEAGEEHLDNLHDEFEKGDDACDLYKRLDEEYDLSYQFAEWAEEFQDE